MKRWTVLCAGVATLAVCAGGPALAQQPQQPPQPSASPGCKGGAPAKVDGQVISVDPNAGKVTIRDKSGTMHEFQTSRETAQTMKPGDTIEATLRQPPNC